MRQQVIFSSVTPANKYAADSTETLTTLVTTGGEVQQLSNVELIRQGYNQDDERLEITCIRSPLLDAVVSDNVITYMTRNYVIDGINRHDFLTNRITFRCRRVS